MKGLNSNRIPDRKTCLELMDKYDMLPHIREHSYVVSKVALSIARDLNSNGNNFDLDEIESASLLHDITKTRSLESGEDHAKTGGELLEKLGYDRIAKIVRAHITPPDCGKRLTVEELVSYADKRVLHTQVVSLNERFDYLFKRYGKDSRAVDRISAARERAQQIEDKIAKSASSGRRAILMCCLDGQ